MKQILHCIMQVQNLVTLILTIAFLHLAISGRVAADQFLRDLEVSTEYTDEMYEHRTLMMKVRMAVSRHLVLLA